MKIEIADSIRSNPELFASVQQANGYLEELAGASSQNIRMEWQLTPHDSRLVELGLFEDRDYHAGIRSTFPADNLLDPVSRKLRLLRAWDFVLQARSKKNQERIHELINQLEGRELDGGQVTD